LLKRVVLTTVTFNEEHLYQTVAHFVMWTVANILFVLDYFAARGYWLSANILIWSHWKTQAELQRDERLTMYVTFLK